MPPPARTTSKRVSGPTSTTASPRSIRVPCASVATMAYAWLRRHPSRPIPITGSGRIEALREAVAALDITLSAEDWYRVWQASMNREVA